MLSDIGSVGFKVDNFNRENMQKLEHRWSTIKEVLTLTVELVSSFGFSGATLRADSALLPIAYYLYMRQVDGRYITEAKSETDREVIRKWLIASFLKSSGIWGSGLDTFLTALRQDIRNCHSKYPTQDIGKTMRARGKSLSFDDDEIDDLTEIRYGDKRTFSLLSLIFPHLDLRQHFHIDHVFPKSRFTRTKLGAAGISQEKIEPLQDASDRLPNLQLLEGQENMRKKTMLPTKWLETFRSDKERENYVTTHLLAGVPDSVHDFESFYEARRLRLREKIVELLN